MFKKKKLEKIAVSLFRCFAVSVFRCLVMSEKVSVPNT